MRSVTQAEIAKRVGVSQRAVASVLGNTQSSQVKVGEETRRRIQAVATEMGYRPHRLAQLLRGNRSRTIAMLTTVKAYEVASEIELMVGEAIRRAEYEAVSYKVLYHKGGLDHALNSILDAKVEGVIASIPDTLEKGPMQKLEEANIPIVRINLENDASNIATVASDYYQGGVLIAQHLMEMQRRRFCAIQGAYTRGVWERIRGFKETVEAAGYGEVEVIAPDVPDEIPGPDGARRFPLDITSVECGRVGMKKILEMDEWPDAIMCTNDVIAVSAMAVCHEKGIEIPNQIAITGFDNATLSLCSWPALTTVHHRVQQLADEAIDVLIRLINKEELSPEERFQLIPCELIPRESTGAGDRALLDGREV